MPARSTGPDRTRRRPVGPRGWHRFAASFAAAFAAATCVLFLPGNLASAAPGNSTCSVADWQDPLNFDRCLKPLPDPDPGDNCEVAPTPDQPDTGLAGWFATEPDSSKAPGTKGLYSRYGYGGYNFSTFDNGCLPQANVTSGTANGIADVEMMIATSIIGAANALRENAWEPEHLWGWANPLVDQATKSVYRKVFTVFGTITLGVIGLYLLWRSRQSDMNAAMTTAGWAILVMVGVTAIAAWPVRAANFADQSLVTGLNVVHSAVGPPPVNTPPSQCASPVAGACVDHRPPAVRAGDTAVETMLYRNWLRGELGSADSPTAKKYGFILYDAKTMTWDESQNAKRDSTARAAILARKKTEWLKVTNQIKTEDPEAYQYITGDRGMDRMGAGIIAILSALFFAMFDIVASLLVLLGFLIFRWAVIAAPILGTIGMLRPASAGLRRLVNAVVAAIFNIIIFGTGAAIYLLAVDLIMSTVSLPGWLQVVLVWLCGVVGWLLLRPYRRVTQLGGKDSAREIAMIGSWHRRFARDARDTTRAPTDPLEDRLLDRRGVLVIKSKTVQLRPETRSENAGGGRSRSSVPTRRAEPATASNRRPEDLRTPESDDLSSTRPPVTTSRGSESSGGHSPVRWSRPEIQDSSAPVSVYRPDSSPAPAPSRRPESTPVRG